MSAAQMPESVSLWRRFAALPLLWIAYGLAAWSLSADLGASEVIFATVGGAGLGVLLGTLLGWSRLRLGWVALSLGLLVAAASAVASLWLASESWVAAVGPGRSLQLTSLLRFGVFALAVSGFLRTVVVRRAFWAGLELLALALALVAAFASHRQGVIARPLWLSDWAWQAGIDPARIFLGMGLVVVALLGAILLVERGRRRLLSSLAVLAAFALLGTFGVTVVGPPKPQPLSDLDLTGQLEGKPPSESPDGGMPHRPPNGADGGRSPQDGASDPSPPDSGQADTGLNDVGRSDGGNDGANRSSDPDAGQPDAGTPDAGQPQDGGGRGGTPPPAPPSQLPDDNSGPTSLPAPVAVVILENDYSPPSEVYFFRQEVLSQFNGVRLVKTTRADADGDVFSDYPVVPTAARSLVPAAGRAKVRAKVALLVEHPQPFALESPVLVAPITNPNPNRFVRAYRFESLAQKVDYRELLGRRALDPAWSESLRSYYLRYPEDPRYAALANTILESLPPARRGDPFARALAVKAYLDKHLTYSTRERHAGVPDPVAHMLFGNRVGYCVHFAHAAVFLWRALGIPSRVGAGYLSEESNRHGGSTILLRASDSHAWPELYLEGLGFVVLDINAERSLDNGRTPPDQELQRMLGEMAREEPPPPPKYAEPRRRGRWVEPFLWGSVAVVAALMGLFLVVAYGIKLWRRSVPWWAPRRSQPRIVYRLALDLLGEAGWLRETGETREAFALRLADRLPSLGPLTASHLAARFRDPRHPDSLREEYDIPKLRWHLSGLKREIRSHSSPWRRYWGLLHPLSFLNTH